MNNTCVRDCNNCKFCTWRKSTYTDILINDCGKSDEISKLSMEELLVHIENNTCEFFEHK
jgi:hypothetical protein